MWQIMNGPVDEVAVNMYFKGPRGGDSSWPFKEF